MGSDPYPAGNILLQLLVLAILIFLNAFFAASEIAVVSLNANKLKKMSEDGNKKARLISKMVDNPSRFLASIQIGVTLSGFLASASAAQSFAEPLTRWLSGFLPIPVNVISTGSVVIITILLSFVTLVFGELVPKRIAMQRAEALAFRVSRILSVFSSIMKPFISLLAATTNGVVRLFGFNPDKSQNNETEEEIRLMVDVGNDAGVIEENQKEMINNIFEFDDRSVDEIMTHRTEMTAIESTATIAEAAELAIKFGYSRIPIYKEDIDDILGIVYAKDILRYLGKDSYLDAPVASIMHRALFIPESQKCRDLFAALTANKLQIAIVLDEYGGTAGLVTMEDLIESIVGSIQDEYDNEEEEIEQVDETTFTVDGTADIIEIERLLDIELPEGDYDTIGGMILYLLKRIPAPDEHPTISVEGYDFTVQSSDERRIETVRIEKTQKTEKEQV